MTSKSSLSFNDVRNKVQADYPQMLQDLTDLVVIPSVSADPQAAEHLEEAAALVQKQFADLGYESRIERVPGGVPAVLAKSPHYEGAPTVLLYAHHDVQPAGDHTRWESPPFEVRVEGDRIYGRGTSDDGAGVIVHLAALRALPPDLPLNIVVFIEGEEEIGSPTFSQFLETYEDDLRADVIIVADSSNWTVDVPAVTSSLRGVVSMDVTVKVAQHAVHSGLFGGPLMDALTAASQLVATLHDEDGDVAVPGLGGSDHADVVWEEADYLRDTAAVEGTKLAGTGDLAARVWTKPSIAVIGIDAPTVDASANAIVPQVTLRLSMRTVPGVDPQGCADALGKYLRDNAPHGAQVTTELQEIGPSYIADMDSPVLQDYMRALTDAWQAESVATGLGASIPFISKFQEVFPDAEIIVTGVEDPQTKAHAENESQSVKVLLNATTAEAVFLGRLAGIINE